MLGFEIDLEGQPEIVQQAADYGLQEPDLAKTWLQRPPAELSKLLAAARRFGLLPVAAIRTLGLQDVVRLKRTETMVGPGFGQQKIAPNFISGVVKYSDSGSANRCEAPFPARSALQDYGIAIPCPHRVVERKGSLSGNAA